MKHFTLLLFFIGVVFIGKAQSTNYPEQKQLVVFLLRHAEKTDNSKNPELSPEGEKRAELLVQMLKDTQLEFIHSTNFKRTINTVSPLAKKTQLEILVYDPQKLNELTDKIKKSGGRHLVVGHSNTTPQMVELLGGDPGTEIDEKSEYDRLYILTVGEMEVGTVLIRYGEKYTGIGKTTNDSIKMF